MAYLQNYINQYQIVKNLYSQKLEKSNKSSKTSVVLFYVSYTMYMLKWMFVFFSSLVPFSVFLCVRFVCLLVCMASTVWWRSFSSPIHWFKRFTRNVALNVIEKKKIANSNDCVAYSMDVTKNIVVSSINLRFSFGSLVCSTNDPHDKAD